MKAESVHDSLNFVNELCPKSGVTRVEAMTVGCTPTTACHNTGKVAKIVSA